MCQMGGGEIPPCPQSAGPPAVVVHTEPQGAPTCQSDEEPEDLETRAALKIQRVYRRRRECARSRARARWARGEALARADVGALRIQATVVRKMSPLSPTQMHWDKAAEFGRIFGDGLESGTLKNPLRTKQAKLMDARYWIEAADPKHRYGSLLVPYYKEWLRAATSDSFFIWLDEGDGSHVDLAEEGHPRAELQCSKIWYMSSEEREAYEVEIRDRKFYWRKSGELVHTGNIWKCGLDLRYRLLGQACRYIYVIDLHDRLFLGRKKKAHLHHSSFLGARPVRAAGQMVVHRGVLLVVNSSSGHYKIPPALFDKTLEMLDAKYGVGSDTGYVKVYPSKRKIGCYHVPAAWESSLMCCRRRSRVLPT